MPEEKTVLNKDLVTHLAGARYLSKRAHGISGTRSDGSECSFENDIEATGAEYFAAISLNQPFNTGIDIKGDSGFDFQISLGVEVVWLGVAKGSEKPRQKGHLIVNPHEPQRWADIYIVVKGSIDTGFEFSGWTSHTQLMKQPVKDFGFGKRYAMHTDDLFNISSLSGLKK